MRNVVVAGVGIHPFGRFEAGYRELGAHAAREALADAGITAADLESAFLALAVSAPPGPSAPPAPPAPQAVQR